jgi:hypothetical protein
MQLASTLDPPKHARAPALTRRRKGFEQRPEVDVDGHQATVEQDEWPAATVRLVVELQPIHRCVRHIHSDRT